MGYTHYWEKKRKLPYFRKVVADAQTLISAVQQQGVEIVGPNGEPDTVPVCNVIDGIIFNGLGDNHHEGFILTAEKKAFTFCKTARKPYDSLVCAVLLAAKHHCKSAILISSDGFNFDPSPGQAEYVDDEWKSPLRLYEQVLKRPAPDLRTLGK